ncbi:MAG: S-adenosylmethionine/arginine decarboxylase-like enzyme [Alphaproteobacteria bacterium]
MTAGGTDATFGTRYYQCRNGAWHPVGTLPHQPQFPQRMEEGFTNVASQCGVPECPGMIPAGGQASESSGAMIDKYGIELILDLHGCDSLKFNRKSISAYFVRLCDLIDMKREALHFWDDVGVSEEDKQTSPHTQGTSAVQFILTSSIVIHTLDQLGAVYINMFSCKEYDPKVAEKFTVEWFGASEWSARFIDRV